MSCFIISGGKRLFGEISVGGSKNAALPIIFATVAMHGVSVIENVPDITDVEVALSIISELGAVITREGTTLTVDTARLTYKNPPAELTERIRASTYLMGASLARFGKTRLPSFGGCNFEPRPIDLHLYAFERLGAAIEGSILTLSGGDTADVIFPKVSVGATVNALLLASSIERTTRIFGHAREPHIIALADFLRSAGAVIEFSDSHVTVTGTRLSGGRARIPTDSVECGTYALLSLMTGGGISIADAPTDELFSLLSPLSLAGAKINTRNGSLSVSGSLDAPISLEAAPYPALPTDLQPPLAPALGAFSGGEIRDRVFPRRFGYIEELRKLGLRAECTEGRVKVLPSRYKAASVTAPDLRGGAALVLAALAADGESVIASSETVMRGYGAMVRKLRSLGAEIYEKPNEN